MEGLLQTMHIQNKFNLEKTQQRSKLQGKEAKCSLLKDYTEFCVTSLCLLCEF